MSDVCVLDCDRQHSIVDKRKFDSQSLQTDKVPYEVKQIEIDRLQQSAQLLKSVKTANGIYLFDSPGNIYLEGMVPLLGFSDVIVCPYQYEFNCLSATQKFLNLVGKIWITYLKGRQKPKLIFVPNLVIRTRGTAAELQTWKKTDEALAQAGGIVTPMVADRADIARYNTFGNTKIQAECVAPAFDMIYNELQKLEAQNDPIPTASEEKEITTAEETTSDTEGEEIIQDESSEVIQVDTTPQRPKVTRARRGRQTNVQPVIEAGSGEWDTMLRYAEFYNDNPDENRITVVLNPDIKRALDIIRINCRQFNFGNILNAVCRTFIERNKEKIRLMQKDKGGIL